MVVDHSSLQYKLLVSIDRLHRTGFDTSALTFNELHSGFDDDPSSLITHHNSSFILDQSTARMLPFVVLDQGWFNKLLFDELNKLTFLT